MSKYAEFLNSYSAAKYEINEKNEESPSEPGVNSLNSLFSYPESEFGEDLVEPFQGMLNAIDAQTFPDQWIEIRGEEMLASDYVQRVCIGIRLGLILDHPALPVWLNNVRSIHAWYDRTRAEAKKDSFGEKGGACSCNKKQSIR